MTRFLTLFAVLAAFWSGQAMAHYYAWSDIEHRFTVSFPDLWKDQGGLPKDGRIRVLAPGADGASCLVFARRDGRFTIYPRDYLVDVVAQEIQWDYWDQAVANYDELYYYYDNFGALGAGDARYTLVEYIDRTTYPGVRKRAIVYATIYADLHMMVHCSAPIETFHTHADDFGQIVSSIKFQPRFTPNERGYYRDFMETKEYGVHWHEPIISLFWPRKQMDAVAQCPRSEDFKECLFKQKPLPIRTR